MNFPILFNLSQTGSLVEWECWTEGSNVFTRWGQKGGTKQVDFYTAKPKNIGKKNETSAETQAEKEALSKWTQMKRKKYHESVAAAESFDGYKPMLAGTFEDHKHKLTYPVKVQSKLDGLRCLAYWKNDRVVLQSRGNKEYDLPHIKSAVESVVKQGFVLDGELYTHGVGLQSINSLVRKPREESTIIQYWVYDCISDDPFNLRIEEVTNIVHGSSIIRPVPMRVAFNEQDVHTYQKEFVADGFEGAMVRTMSCPYRQGARSRELLKVKSWLDAEFPIVGMKEGKDGLPVFICGMEDGRTFDARPKGTEKERLEMKANIDQLLGKMLTVKYFDLTDEGKPHFGVGLGIREEE